MSSFASSTKAIVLSGCGDWGLQRSIRHAVANFRYEVCLCGFSFAMSWKCGQPSPL